MEDWLTIVIPTRDSAQWIGVLLDHYRARGFTPIVLLDARTTDDTSAVAVRAGARVVDIGGFTFTEAIVGITRSLVTTPWALFLHDDEVPSDALFARLREAPPSEVANSVAIARRWAWYSPGEPLMYGSSDQWPDRTGQPGTDHAWRLFRPDRVSFIPKMHTEGFLIDNWARMPLDSYFVHFEWVIRSHSQRIVKLRNYDRHRYGYGRFFEKVYLPETQAEGVIRYLPFGCNTFDVLSEAYYAARKAAPRIPSRMMREHVAHAKAVITRKLGLEDLSREPKDRAGLTPNLNKEVSF